MTGWVGGLFGWLVVRSFVSFALRLPADEDDEDDADDVDFDFPQDIGWVFCGWRSKFVLFSVGFNGSFCRLYLLTLGNFSAQPTYSLKNNIVCGITTLKKGYISILTLSSEPPKQPPPTDASLSIQAPFKCFIHLHSQFQIKACPKVVHSQIRKEIYNNYSNDV